MLSDNEQESLQYIKILESNYNAFKDLPSEYQKVGWGSQENQFLRFSILSSISESFFHSKILDYGCGLGGFYEFIQGKNFTGKYLGYDILSEMLEKCLLKYPGINFKSDYDDFNPDIIIASGIFTFSSEDYMKKEIAKMFSIANKGIAFNSLSDWSPNKENNEFYADPIKTLEFCSTLTSKVVLRHDYLPHDFTIYMYK